MSSLIYEKGSQHKLTVECDGDEYTFNAYKPTIARRRSFRTAVDKSLKDSNDQALDEWVAKQIASIPKIPDYKPEAFDHQIHPGLGDVIYEKLLKEMSRLDKEIKNIKGESEKSSDSPTFTPTDASTADSS